MASESLLNTQPGKMTTIIERSDKRTPKTASAHGEVGQKRLNRREYHKESTYNYLLCIKSSRVSLNRVRKKKAIKLLSERQ